MYIVTISICGKYQAHSFRSYNEAIARYKYYKFIINFAGDGKVKISLGGTVLHQYDAYMVDSF